MRTDHAVLTWLRRTPDPIGQQARWLEVVEGFTFTVQHRPGRLHSNADAMSRRPCRQCGVCGGVNITRIVRLSRTDDHGVIWSNEDNAQRQEDDSDMRLIYLAEKLGDEVPAWRDVVGESREVKIYWKLWSQLEMRDGMLVYRYSSDKWPKDELRILLPACYR